MKQPLFCLGIAFLAVFVSCRSQKNAATPSSDVDISVTTKTTAAMKDVLLQITETAAVHILELQAELAPKDSSVLNLDDLGSYGIRLARAEVTATPDNVARLLNDRALSQKDAPVKKLEIRIKDGQLEVKGWLNKLIDIPFEIVGRPEVTNAGEIALATTSIHAAGVPVKGLLDVFGAEVADLVKGDKIPGIRIVDNTVIVSLRALPFTFIDSQFSAITVEDDHLTVSLRGSAPPSHVALPNDGHYVFLTGGGSRFLKLTMNPTNLEIVGQTGKSPLFFDLHNYRPQLLAGMVRVTKDDGLIIHLAEEEQAATPRKSPE